MKKSRSMPVEIIKCGGIQGNQCLLFYYCKKIETSVEKVSHSKFLFLRCALLIPRSWRLECCACIDFIFSLAKLTF